MRLLRIPGRMEVLIPSVMALRETAMTAPLGQQGEPLPSSVTAAPCHLPPREGLEERIVTGGNPTVIPGTDSELVGADALIGPMGNVLKLEWVDVLNRPLRILTEIF